MNMSNYQNMYNKMEIPDKMDRKIKENVAGILESKKTTRKKVYRTGFAVAAAFALMVCVANIDSVVAGAKNIVEYFKYTFIVEDKDGTTEEINIVGEYVTISSDAPKKECYMDSIADAEEKLKVELLDSDESGVNKGSFEYTPYLTDDKEVYGLILSNKSYVTGDIYQTPIAVEITVRTDKDMTGMYDNNEIGYISESRKIDLSGEGNTYDAEIYELENLGIDVVIYSVETDGPAEWNITDGYITCTTAVFVYQGVEYAYLGGVDRDTMKIFLDTLK